METLYYSQMNSLIGPLNLAVSEKGLLSLEFDRNNFPPKKTKYGWEESAKAIKPFTRELEEYFAGKRREFTFPLDLRGTEFQVKCWRALLAIPYGETRSYADIARAVRKPFARWEWPITGTPLRSWCRAIASLLRTVRYAATAAVSM